ncbi:MAG: hypothetical protein HOO96_25260 [Polyangiaceae bacterium]|nr:hypothetical protein [Polyangiaceae bacterium]
MRRWRKLATSCLAAAFLALGSNDAAAQCGAKRSTCSDCHDGAHAARAAEAPWHADHSFADLCVGCHGGRGDQAAEPAAHEGLGDPRDLAKCSACHADANALLARYAPTAASVRDGGADAAPTGSGAPSPRAPSPHGDPGPNLVLAGLVGVVALLAAGVVVRQERLRAASSRSAVSKV